MSEVKLVRFAASDEGVRGILTLPNGHSFCTMEMPWRNNQKQISCIPEGSYPCVWANSGNFGMCYHVNSVPNRSEILIHNGNFAGDETKGYKTHSKGCILIGNKHGLLFGQRAVLGSVSSRALFESIMATKPFTLVVTSDG